MNRAAIGRLLAAALALCGAVAQAAPEEIQVYLDELSAPGQFGIDLHNNVALSASSTPAYAGAVPPDHVYRLTPEFYYGLTPELELGWYVLTSRTGDGAASLDGSKLRLKYIAPHDEHSGAFWGLNFEFGRTRHTVSEQPWNAQLKGIVGYRDGAWTVGANPNLDWSPSPGGGPVLASLDLKVARAVAEGTQLGAELYSELGPASRIQGWRRNGKTLYLVLDRTVGADVDIDFGIGHGLTPDADRWVLKFIAGTHF
ncbi:MAG: hypothetical protein KGN16_22725 [Burkholderiales bacterium]|nr:hypothetical protein [Burkholderiales bacterium]